MGSFLFFAWCYTGKEGTSKEVSRSSKIIEGVQDSSRGKVLYGKHCGSCHQASGSGVPGMYPPLNETETVQGDKEALIRIVLEGMEGAIEVKGKRYNRSMPAQDHLSNEEVARILNYVRRKFGNGASKLTVSEVGRVRKGVE